MESADIIFSESTRPAMHSRYATVDWAPIASKGSHPHQWLFPYAIMSLHGHSPTSDLPKLNPQVGLACLAAAYSLCAVPL